MTGDLIPANVLATHTIANVSETLAEKLGFTECCRKPKLRTVRGQQYDGLTFRKEL